MHGNFAKITHTHNTTKPPHIYENYKFYPILRFLSKPENWPFVGSTHTLQVISIISLKKTVCIKRQHVDMLKWWLAFFVHNLSLYIYIHVTNSLFLPNDPDCGKLSILTCPVKMYNQTTSSLQ